MPNAQFYHAYKLQNPVKYAHKFGDKTPEELADTAPVSGLSPTPGVEIQITPVKEIEMEFAPAPVPEPVFAPEPDVVKPKKKKK